MEYPLVSIIIATFNSGLLLPRTLDAILRQSYPTEKIEILIVDGRSTDHTIEIAKQYGCKILYNDKTEPVNAKLIGAKAAKGRFLVTIDHDEVLENADSILLKVEALLKNPECKVALCSGYKKPINYPRLNQYVSEFGDPFSFFIYNFPKGDGFLEKTIKSNYSIKFENEKIMVVSFEKMKKQPILELCCLGTMIDRDYFLHIPGAFDEGRVMVHLFYYMLERGEKSIIFVKNDAILHYSVDSLKSYFPKLKWRVCNNIHFSEMAKSGFGGRIEHQTFLKYKKLFFVPYTMLGILPIIDGLKMAISRNNAIYLMHFFFCWYVLIQIIYQYALKMLNITPHFLSYDGKKRIE